MKIVLESAIKLSLGMQKVLLLKMWYLSNKIMKIIKIQVFRDRNEGSKSRQSTLTSTQQDHFLR